MKTPDNFRRNYKFKTNTKAERRIMNITVATIIVALVIWYAYQIWG
jgi:hypothetical protein